MLGSDRILALDIGAATIKVAEFAGVKPHGLRLVNFNHADMGLDLEHEENRKAVIISTIRNVLREKNIKTKHVVFSVSGQSVFTRFVKLPPVDESKVVQIIQYEAQQNVPFPIDEVIWDYQLVGSSAAGEIEVVLLAIKSDIIEELNEGVESAGLHTEMVDVAPMALYNAVRYNYGEMEGCTLVVDIGARTSNLLFLEQNKVFSRAIPIAGNAITQQIATEFSISFLEADALKRAKGFVALGGAYEEPEDEQQSRVSKIIRNTMTKLHADIQRSINFYKGQQGGSAPVRVLLSGGSSILPYTDRFFKEKLNVTVEYFNPFRNVDIDPSLSRDELSKCAHFYGEVVGLGLRKHAECPIEVNLLPRSIRQRKLMSGKRPYFIGAAVCLLLVPLCWLAYTKERATLMQKQLTDVSEEVEKVQKLSNDVGNQRTRLEELQGKAGQLVSLVNQRSAWVEFFQQVNTRVPSTNLWIVSLTPQVGAAGDNIPPGLGAIPVAPGGRPLHGGPIGVPGFAPPVALGPRTFTEVLFAGAGKHSTADPEEDLRLVEAFRQNLRTMPLFIETNGVEIVESPDILTKKTNFTFKVSAKLSRSAPF